MFIRQILDFQEPMIDLFCDIPNIAPEKHSMIEKMAEKNNLYNPQVSKREEM